MRILSSDDVLQSLNDVDVIPYLERAFVGLANGSSIQPPQVATTFPNDAGDTIFYPSVLLSLGLIGVTVSPYLAELERSGKDPVTAYSLILSSATGLPEIICEARSLVAIRTGATTALAIRELSHSSDRQVAVIGAGMIAEWHARQVVRIRDWDSIVFYSPSLNTDERALRREALSGIDSRVSFADSLASAISEADVVMLCTSSAVPVVTPELIKKDALITSISTDGPLAHEIPPVSLLDMDVYCDYRVTTPDIAGEMVYAREQHGWDPTHIVADLPELLSGVGAKRELSGRRRFFRSVGLGIEDLAVAAALVEKATNG